MARRGRRARPRRRAPGPGGRRGRRGLWARAPRERRPHPRWHRTRVLRRRGDRSAGGAGDDSAGEGALSRALRHGRGHGGRAAGRGVRAGGRRAGGVPAVRIVGAARRPARDRRRGMGAGRAGGATVTPGDARRQRGRGAHGPGQAPRPCDGARHARALVRGARRRAALEARVQRAPGALTLRGPTLVAARYLVGIDLGTTNTACAYVDTTAGRTIRAFDVPQLVAPGRVVPRPTLPSFLYLAG